MQHTMSVKSNHYEHAGPKPNEDSWFSKTKSGYVFAAVADGVGGLESSEYASGYITKRISSWIDDNIYKEISMQDIEVQIKKLISDIHDELHTYVSQNNISLGSTLTLFCMNKEEYFVVQVGDSRLYFCNKKECKQITEDQTVDIYEAKNNIDINDMFPNNPIDKETKSHMLYQCIGYNVQGNKPIPIFTEGKVESPCSYLLCTDGLSNTLSEKDLKMAINNKNQSDKEILKDLVKLARYRGETDNITCVIISVESGDA